MAAQGNKSVPVARYTGSEAGCVFDRRYKTVAVCYSLLVSILVFSLLKNTVSTVNSNYEILVFRATLTY